MQIIGKMTPKKYRCECGYESTHSTNHFGEFYAKCPNCSWKTPMDPIKTHECLEPLPEGWDRPVPWKKVRLGDIADANPEAAAVIRKALDDAAAKLED